MKRSISLGGSENNDFHLVVIGGGAAGYFAAIRAAEIGDPSEPVLILEKAPQVLGKVRISGGGRCNVTHACFDPRTFATHYPRGEKALIGPLHRWDAQKTIDWFEDHGVQTKTEKDGRIFPTTDNSQTIIDCLCDTAEQLGIETRTRTNVSEISHDADAPYPFSIQCTGGSTIRSKNLLIATGGTRCVASESLLQFTGHKIHPAVPSLFTFNIPKNSLSELAGISVKHASVTIPEAKLNSHGPLLITHWGLSGPAILKLSARGARKLHSVEYTFTAFVNWLPNEDLEISFSQLRTSAGKRSLISRSPFPELPKRLWEKLIERGEIDGATTWSQISKKQLTRLREMLTHCAFDVSGKSMNKEEFVTCGGVELNKVSLKTMESRRIPGLYFAGEVLNIDGITGGFNFQNAWTTGYLAGSAIGETSGQF
ncbi:MAG: NAD(P)/FAD-dependent oxidoreductase [Opitutales bacterium]|nr:NAD(P)/FAD-dependent oxidoreductase [Opitutales bacterium]